MEPSNYTSIPKITITSPDPLKDSIDNIFYVEWEKRLKEHQVFDKDDQDRIVNAENLMKVLKAINID